MSKHPEGPGPEYTVDDYAADVDKLDDESRRAYEQAAHEAMLDTTRVNDERQNERTEDK